MAKDTATPDAGNGPTDLNTPAAIADRLDGIDGLFGDEFDDDEDGGAPAPPRKGGKPTAKSDEDDDGLSDDDEDDGLLGDDEDDDDAEADDEDEETDEQDEDEEQDEDDEDTDDEVPDSGKPKSKIEKPNDDMPVTVKVAGEEVTVTLAELKKGYSREQDYTRKTMALSEQEKQYGLLIQQLTTYLDAATAPEQEPDWADLEANDPVGFAVQKAKWGDLLEQRRVAREEQQRLQGEKEKEFIANYTSYIEEQKSKLVTLIPAWKDPKVARRETAAIKVYLKENGFSDDDISKLNRAEAVALIRKAALYDRLKRGASNKAKPKSKMSKRARPGVRSSAASDSRGVKRDKSYAKARARLKKSGSAEDAVDALDRLGIFSDDE